MFFFKALLLVIYICAIAAVPLDLPVIQCTVEDAEQGKACEPNWSYLPGLFFQKRKPGICVMEHAFLEVVCPVFQGHIERMLSSADTYCSTFPLVEATGTELYNKSFDI